VKPLLKEMLFFLNLVTRVMVGPDPML